MSRSVGSFAAVPSFCSALNLHRMEPASSDCKLALAARDHGLVTSGLTLPFAPTSATAIEPATGTRLYLRPNCAGQPVMLDLPLHSNINCIGGHLRGFNKHMRSIQGWHTSMLASDAV
ncbi:uncharacterized protein LMH87_009101 [Akanthomyces muscarius]|uniref:Uncharacterized protein n=1 Tax=Akanthomyces muscarius TaxID=2231603 RepID=A0A9W8QKJ2_AKAMU|nr:uncharacterized protein LMH87_009101 [Akanthomyces muscarius]KAJ4158582.1 hypothetical protein LMH87_009101 [Akanthomyces muscarius]